MRLQISMLCILLLSCKVDKDYALQEKDRIFTIIQSENAIEIKTKIQDHALVTQNAQQHHRPYLHPILAPNSNASLTEFSPDHHKHQTGLYWGFTRVNGLGASEEELQKWFYNPNKPRGMQEKIGRDFFHHPTDGYWEKVALTTIIGEGPEVKWQTIYNMLDEKGEAIMQETQTWTFSEVDGKHILSLDWQGKAINQDVVINEFSYGGMFLRMPWNEEINGEVINAARQKNKNAEGQRAMWVDVGMEIEGLDNWGHITIFDHPDNEGFPTTWRVDGQLGIGPNLSGMGDWNIKKGDSKTFRHQLVAYQGDLNDVEMNDLWGKFAGDKGMYNTASLWGIAQEEGRNAKFLDPQEAVDEMTIKDGYKVNVFAAEPTITQPMAFCWDDKGRMWIAENRDYESRAYGFANSGDSRILILEDTDQDGVVDESKVFLENIPFPAGIAVGFDGLFLGAPPNLLFVPDRDGDDKADQEDIEVLLTGWGIRDRHETINSLTWGPDGWLYGLEGFATPSKIRKPIGKGRIYKAGEEFPEDLLDADGIDMNGGVFRYHPIKDEFEVVSHGFSNPWGIDYDAKGQLFISACVIPHLFHIIPGGIYHRQGGKHFNPYVYEDIQTIVDHRHRSAHGGARIYQSDAFPSDQQGRIFMANIHEHAVLSDILKPNGSGFTASHGEDFMNANNAQWIGFSMEVGPEGGLYVLDWHDGDICGKEVLHKETGRVFRIMPEKSNAEDWEKRYGDLNSFSDKELVDLQESKSNWHSQRARVILQHRGNKAQLSSEALQRLDDLLSDANDIDIRLRALWTKHITRTISTDELEKLFSDKDQYIRAWAIQCITEDKDPSQITLQKMLDLAKNESSPVVRLYLASALQRIDESSRWEIIESLVSYADDANDPNIPFMIWFGMESLVVQDEDRALSIAQGSKIPMITKNIARRIVDEGHLVPLVTHIGMENEAQFILLEGMLAGLQGRTDLAKPANWEDVYSRLIQQNHLNEIVSQVNQQFGGREIAQQMLSTLKNPSANTQEKKSAIKNLASQQREELVELIPVLIQDDTLRDEAIRSIAAFDDSKLGRLILDNYDSFTLTEKQEAIQSLASRHQYGWQLAQAIRDEHIQKRDIPAYIALQLRRVVGNGFVEIWGPIDDINGDVQAEYNKYTRLLNDQDIALADIHNGKLIYQRTCFVCHKMHDVGGVLGPDLTGSNRTNTAYLLSNILEPSGEIQDDYKLVVITTRDGRTYTGNITAENERQVTLRTVNEDALHINRSDIQQQEQTEKSMMPEGLLKTLTDQEVLDLFAFMKHLEPVGNENADD